MIKNQSAQGFTLIELMIVISIVGILVSIAVPQFIAYRLKGYNSLAMSDIKNASIAQEAYYADYQTYTSDLATLTEYGFRQTQGVTVKVPSNDDKAYTITSNHDKGDRKYTLVGPGGNVSSD